MPNVEKPKPATVTLRLSEPLRQWVENRAAEFEVTVSEYLRLLIINRMEGMK